MAEIFANTNPLTFLIIILVLLSVVLIFKVYEDTEDYSDNFLVRVFITLIIGSLGIISIFFYMIVRELIKTAKEKSNK